MTLTIRRIAERLSAKAMDVCAYYLSNGRKTGQFWHVGDVYNAPGQSLYVRLTGPAYGPGAAGKWTDTATGEHGDLLDLIRLNRGLPDVHAAKAEALRFLSEPAVMASRPIEPVARNSPAAARRLFMASRPVIGTLGESYLRRRGITCSLDLAALRFHPRCFYLAADTATRMELPALISAVTDLDGAITGVQRLYLSNCGTAKAPISTPRRGLGDFLGHAIRFGAADTVMAAGEGVETVLAVRSLLPGLPMAAATSANHLAALLLPPSLLRLYIILDRGHAGQAAAETLALRALEQGIDVRLLTPLGDDDWNSDLQNHPAHVLQAAITPQLDDADGILSPWAGGT